jgi:palmitoyltransferase
MFGLFLMTALNSVVVFGLFILLARTLWCLGANTTTIEGWEIERHETLLRRARYLGGVLEGPNGAKVRITRQEYPWDIGIFSNIAQGMGSWNPIAWFWPFSFTPSIESGLEFEDNGLEGTYMLMRDRFVTNKHCSSWYYLATTGSGSYVPYGAYRKGL